MSYLLYYFSSPKRLPFRKVINHCPKCFIFPIHPKTLININIFFFFQFYEKMPLIILFAFLLLPVYSSAGQLSMNLFSYCEIPVFIHLYSIFYIIFRINLKGYMRTNTPLHFFSVLCNFLGIHLYNAAQENGQDCWTDINIITWG